MLKPHPCTLEKLPSCLQSFLENKETKAKAPIGLKTAKQLFKQQLGSFLVIPRQFNTPS